MDIPWKYFEEEESNAVNFEKNHYYGERARKLIPGGAHTYSKGDDQFPANAPRIIEKGRGCRLWDVDGNEWHDFAMSLGTIILGHAYKPVLEAVQLELKKGVNFCRPSLIEGELAELLQSIIPSAEMVKLAKHGSDATTGAVRLARAYTGRDKILRCKNDPFNSIHDWFIGSTVMNSGVPYAVQELTLQFEYNNFDSLKAIFEENPNEIACVLLEPISFERPRDNFLQEVKKLCEKEGAILIFDEVVSGFRFSLGGAQEVAGVTPHLSAFGKAMANGFSVSALVGDRELMKLGGIDHKGERTFLLSTTHGGETHAIAAAIKTIQEIQNKNVIQHLWNVGRGIKEVFEGIARKAGLESFIHVDGYDCKPALIITNEHGTPDFLLRTLFLQEMAREQVLIPYIVPSFAHKEEDMKKLAVALENAFSALKQAIDSKRPESFLMGSPIKPVFRKDN